MKVLEKVYTYDYYSKRQRITARMLEESLEAYDLYKENLSIINQVAHCYYGVNNYFMALDFVLKAHTCDEASHQPDEYYYTLKLTGDIYRKLSIHETAIVYYMEALKHSGHFDLERKRCDLFRHMATVYTQINTFDLGTDYAVEALQMAEYLEDKKLIGDANLVLCRIHTKRSLFDKALKYGLKTIEMYKVMGVAKGLVLSYLEIAFIYSGQKNYELARSFYESALTISTEIGFDSGRIFSNYLLGKLLYKQGYTARALFILEDALELSRRNNIQTYKVDLYYQLSEIYADKGEFELAYNAYKTGTELNEHLKADLHKERIYQLQNDYNLYIKEQQLKTYEERNSSLEKKNQLLSEEVITDPLTGLLNRRGLKNSITDLNYSGKHVIILCDIDDFKLINDQYGHPCGDILLKGISNVIFKNSKSHHHLARWGGEEFLMVLPETSQEAGIEYAYKMKELIADSIFNSEEHQFNVTMTFGLAPLVGDFETSIHLADQRLYNGKRNGKNQVVFRD